MKEIRKILLFLLGATLLGALLAPWIFWGGHALELRTHWSFLRDLDFAKCVDRGVLLGALLLIWPTIRSLRIKSRAQLGIERDPHGWRNLSIGLVSGFLFMAAFGVLLLWLEVYRMKVDPPWTALLKIAVTAITVALLEEWLFRGVILGFLRQALLDWPAVFCSSALFSIIHFIKPPGDTVQQVDWLTGLRVLPTCFAKFADPALLAAGFSTLLLLGVMLGWSVLRTRALWLGIGLHAGLVFGKFGFTKLTKRSLPDTLPWIGDDLIVGVGALVVLSLSWLLAWALLRYADRRHRRTARW